MKNGIHYDKCNTNKCNNKNAFETKDVRMSHKRSVRYKSHIVTDVDTNGGDHFFCLLFKKKK